MTKQAEIDYPSMIGAERRVRARDKPFSEDDCGLLLCDVGTVINLLPRRPARVLELGCGGGWFSCFLARHGYEVVGVDISSDMIALAEQNRGTQALPNLKFTVGDYETLGFSNEFDAVVFYDSLHHADSEHDALAAAFKALKPGGLLITHEPGEGHSKAPASIEAMKLYGVNERDMPPHHIIKVGKEVGFSGWHVFPMPLTLSIIVYRQYSRSWLLNWLLVLARLAKMLLYRPRRLSAITVLTK